MNTGIKTETTEKHLSAFGGLELFSKCWQKLGLASQMTGILPSAPKSLKKFEDLTAGFAAGAECLDDMAEFSKDDGFLAVCDEKVYTPKSYGDYLRGFSQRHIDELNKTLARSAFVQRAAATPNLKTMTFDFDSSSNRQYGQKMEGVRYSGEKGYECLTTMYVFDELGNQYYSDVRSGTTHTSQDISKIIHMIMSQMPKKGSYAAEEVFLPGIKNPYHKKTRVRARADAGYSNKEFVNACFAKDIGFVVRLRADMLDPNIPNLTKWKKAKQRLRKVNCRGGGSRYLDETIRFYDGREAEIGSTLYQTDGVAGSCRIVCIRAKKPERLGLKEEDFDYFAWLTNIGEHEMKDEEIIRFYRGRGHAENYIRELKNGYDMHHYPCLKLDANRAYALIAAFAHNVLRFVSLRSRGKRPQFAKAIRNRFINLPCQVPRAKALGFSLKTSHRLVFRAFEMEGRASYFPFHEPKSKGGKSVLRRLKNLADGFGLTLGVTDCTGRSLTTSNWLSCVFH